MEDLIQIGKTAKPHGLEGGLRFAIKDEYLEDFLSVEVIFIEEKGQPVPYFIEDVKGQHFVVQLEGVSSKEQASSIANKKVSIRTADLIPEEDKTYRPDEAEYEFCVGYVMMDEVLGEIGEIIEIVEYPQQEMASINYKEKEILIPLNNDFIKEIREKEKKIIMSLPEGVVEVQL